MIRMILFLALASFMAAPAFARAATPPESPSPSAANTKRVTAREDSLYRHLGEQAGIERIVADFTKLVTKDPRTAEDFTETDLDHFRTSLTEQLCELSGGPCHYDGPNMRDAHTGFDITKAQFAAVVEDLQAAMRKSHIPYRAQNELLALLAPMHRDIVQK